VSKASKIIDKMFLNDPFSLWLEIKRIEEKEGAVVLELTVREEMLNGFGIAHGGITYSLADSALAFSANGYGIQSVSIETSISHTKSVKLGDVLRTKVTEESLTSKIGIYTIHIYNQENMNVALFKGTVFRTGKKWDV
jgi:acyl-CoA thioesterase|tara:strand:+ start:10821 stop:11234 length:414 start_codon:yes stop_codon:yes gene_type:complete